MIFSFKNNGSSEPLEVQMLDVIHNALHRVDVGAGDTEYEVLPLVGIPVGCEDTPLHDGVNPCGDPTCYCAVYGYEEEQ